MDEGSGLPPSPVYGQRVPDRSLDEKSVENCSIVPVIIKPVDDVFVQLCLFGVRAPHHALVQVGDADAVVATVKLEEQGILRFSHVVDTSRTRRIQDLELCVLPAVKGHLHPQIAFRDRRSSRLIPIDTHGAEVH